MIYLIALILVIIISLLLYIKLNKVKVYFRLHKENKIKDYLEPPYIFPNGTRIYQIKSEYIMTIHSERNRIIEEYLNYISYIGTTKAELSVGLQNIKKLASNIVLKPYEAESLDDRDNIYKICDRLMVTAPEAIRAINEYYKELFCMFFVLDGEDFRNYDEKYNTIKKQLLEENPKEKVFFFKALENATQHLQTSYRNAILIASQTLIIKEQMNRIVKEYITTNTTKK